MIRSGSSESVKKMLNVIYEDEAVLVAEKPAGVDAQETRGFGRDMVSEIKKYLVKKGAGNPYVGVVHRLDKPVRGVMVFAKTREAAAALSEQMAQTGHMEKEYLALVCGKPCQESGHLVDNLYFDRAANTSRVVEKVHTAAPELLEKQKRAELTYKLLADAAGGELERALEDGSAWSCFQKELKRLDDAGMIGREEPYSLLRIGLLTGRHHQIRVQLAHAGHPILGDVKYNPAMKDFRGMALCLCACKIGFVHPLTGKKMRFWLGNIDENVTNL